MHLASQADRKSRRVENNSVLNSCLLLCFSRAAKIDASVWESEKERERERAAAVKKILNLASTLCTLTRATNATPAYYIAIKIDISSGQSARSPYNRDTYFLSWAMVRSLAREWKICFEIHAMTRQFPSRVIKSPSVFSRFIYAQGYLTLLESLSVDSVFEIISSTKL